MQFNTFFTVLATLAATYAAPSPSVTYSTVSCPSSTGTIGSNLQAYTGALGGIKAPAVYGTSLGYETCKKEYTQGGPFDALNASCTIQNTNCLSAAKAGVKGVTKSGCSTEASR
ncbi:MAG: hypothetical protein TREMPRED_003324 [Tremellales sp. Tagirdzhanova-0007]|nr:MAG: hypothetical protein TREMPRED_003324 [Tremellales sp. Tagirdzhanova-0007]